MAFAGHGIRIVAALATGLMAGSGLLAEPAEVDLTVEQAVIAIAVENREPVGEGTMFPADVGELVCYTKILGASVETAVEHVWYQGDVERARVRLPVRSRTWRTWSTKNIASSWTGSWTVEVSNEDGVVLDTLAFEIVAADRMKND